MIFYNICISISGLQLIFIIFLENFLIMLIMQGISFLSTTSGISNGAGGHYTSNREAYPDESIFCASGFNQIRADKNSEVISGNHPHYILFKS
jgi:hypothetical protein